MEIGIKCYAYLTMTKQFLISLQDASPLSAVASKAADAMKMKGRSADKRAIAARTIGNWHA